MDATDPDDSGSLGSPLTGVIDRGIASVRRLNEWMHWIAGTAVVGLMFLTVIDVVGRRFFNSPFRGTVEITEMAMVVIIYLGFSYAEDQGDHIAVDVVYNRLRRTVQLILTAITSLFGIVVVTLLAWRIYVFAGVLDGGGYTTATRGIPQAPFALTAVAGSVMFALALLASAIIALRRFREQSS